MGIIRPSIFFITDTHNDEVIGRFYIKIISGLNDTYKVNQRLDIDIRHVKSCSQIIKNQNLWSLNICIFEKFRLKYGNVITNAGIVNISSDRKNDIQSIFKIFEKKTIVFHNYKPIFVIFAILVFSLWCYIKFEPSDCIISNEDNFFICIYKIVTNIVIEIINIPSNIYIALLILFVLHCYAYVANN